MVSSGGKPTTSDDLQGQPERDSSAKGHAAHKQSTEPHARSKQDSKHLLSFSDAVPMITPPSQQPMTDSQIQEWVVGPQYSQGDGLGVVLPTSQEPNITFTQNTQDSQSLHAQMVSEAARQAARTARNRIALENALRETALKEVATSEAATQIEPLVNHDLVLMQHGQGAAPAANPAAVLGSGEGVAAGPAAAGPAGAGPAAGGQPAVPLNDATAALVAGLANTPAAAALHALAAAAASGGIPPTVPGQQMTEADYNQLQQQQQQYYQQIQAMQYQQIQQRHASVAKPEHAGSVAKRRGPMDEMRQLQRILTKLLPKSGIYMPSGSDGGGNKVQAEQIKVYLAATLGEAPKPDWGLKLGWGHYLADLFNWATGRDDITNYDAMECARRQQGRSWEVLFDKLIQLGVYSWNWDIPLKLEQVRNCSKEPPKELQRQHAALAAAAATAAAAAGGSGINKRSSTGGNSAAAAAVAAANAMSAGAPMPAVNPAVMQMAVMQMAASMSHPAAAAAATSLAPTAAAVHEAAVPASAPVAAAAAPAPPAAGIAAAPPASFPPPAPLPPAPVAEVAPPARPAHSSAPAALQPLAAAMPSGAASAPPPPPAAAAAAAAPHLAAAPVVAGDRRGNKLLATLDNLSPEDWLSAGTVGYLEYLGKVLQQGLTVCQHETATPAAPAAGSSPAHSRVAEGIDEVQGLFSQLISAVQHVQQQLQQQHQQQQQQQHQQQQQQQQQQPIAPQIAAAAGMDASALAAAAAAAAPWFGQLQQLAQLLPQWLPYLGGLGAADVGAAAAAGGAAAQPGLQQLQALIAAAAGPDRAAAAAQPVELPRAVAARLQQQHDGEVRAAAAAEHEEEEAEEVPLSMTDHGAIPPHKLELAADSPVGHHHHHHHIGAGYAADQEEDAFRKSLHRPTHAGKVNPEAVAARLQQRRRKQQQRHRSSSRQQQPDYEDEEMGEAPYDEVHTSVSNDEDVLNAKPEDVAAWLRDMSQGHTAGAAGSVMSSPVKSTASNRRGAKRKAAEAVDDEYGA